MGSVSFIATPRAVVTYPSRQGVRGTYVIPGIEKELLSSTKRNSREIRIEAEGGTVLPSRTNHLRMGESNTKRKEIV